jgi:hypothetical protein
LLPPLLGVEIYLDTWYCEKKQKTQKQKLKLGKTTHLKNLKISNPRSPGGKSPEYNGGYQPSAQILKFLTRSFIFIEFIDSMSRDKKASPICYLKVKVGTLEVKLFNVSFEFHKKGV